MRLSGIDFMNIYAHTRILSYIKFMDFYILFKLFILCLINLLTKLPVRVIAIINSKMG